MIIINRPLDGKLDFPYKELTRVVPDKIYAYTVEKQPETQNTQHEKWRGSLSTVCLKNASIPDEKLRVSGIICVNSDKETSPVFWFDLSDHLITEVQCFLYTKELVVVLLQGQGKTKETLLEVLSRSI